MKNKITNTKKVVIIYLLNYINLIFMSIWGSLIGGMIGFSLGGPWNALGSLIGGKISRAKGSINNSFANLNKYLHYL